jgi:single-stranded-DNA-specific exonuclease
LNEIGVKNGKAFFFPSSKFRLSWFFLLPMMVILKTPDKKENFMNSFFTKLAGVTFEGRQNVIRTLTVGQTLYFVREPDNKYDQNAINVKTEDGRSVGFIAKDKNFQLAYDLDHGKKFGVVVAGVTGGGFDCAYGVNVKVEAL